MKTTENQEVNVKLWIKEFSLMPVPSGKGRNRDNIRTSAVLALLDAAHWAMQGDCLTGDYNHFTEGVSDERVSLLYALRAVGLNGLPVVELTRKQKQGAMWLVCGELEMPVWAIGQGMDELRDLGLGSTLAELSEWLG